MRMHKIMDYNKKQNKFHSNYRSMQTSLTCKEALSIVQMEAANTVASTTRKGNSKTRLNSLHLENELPNYARIHKNVAKTSVQNYKQIEQKFQKIVWQGCEPPPILRLFMKPQKVLCSITKFGARSLLPRIALKLGGKKTDLFPYKLKRPAAIAWNTSNFRSPWDISVH